jgi:hypothetical protein
MSGGLQCRAGEIQSCDVLPERESTTNRVWRAVWAFVPGLVLVGCGGRMDFGKPGPGGQPASVVGGALAAMGGGAGFVNDSTVQGGTFEAVGGSFGSGGEIGGLESSGGVQSSCATESNPPGTGGSFQVGGMTSAAAGAATSTPAGGAMGGDAGGAGTGGTTVAASVPVQIPSRQKVTFQLTNGTDAPLYVGSVGYDCEAYSIAGPTQVKLAMEYYCGCECNPPPRPHIQFYLVILPQQKQEIVWDARTLKTYGTLLSCPDWGYSATVTYGVWQPVTPGAYTVTLRLETAIPPGCAQYADSLGCTLPSSLFNAVDLGGGICPSRSTAQASFDIPQDGDVVVPITL